MKMSSFDCYHILTNITILKKLRLLKKLRYLTKISIFWSKFRFLTKISIFDQKFDFDRILGFLTLGAKTFLLIKTTVVLRLNVYC